MKNHLAVLLGIFFFVVSMPLSADLDDDRRQEQIREDQRIQDQRLENQRLEDRRQEQIRNDRRAQQR